MYGTSKREGAKGAGRPTLGLFLQIGFSRSPSYFSHQRRDHQMALLSILPFNPSHLAPMIERHCSEFLGSQHRLNKHAL